MSSSIIRHFEPADTDACYEICLRTGDLGADASRLHSDPRLLGEIWVGPYLARWPDFAFVLEDGLGVAGYIVGAPDTATHEEWLEHEWFPRLRDRYPLDKFAADSADGECVRHLHHPPTTTETIAAEYPAHLHIDLLPRTQGQGAGRRLIERFLRACHDAGVGAVHLGCGPDNPGALAFYQRLGFSDLSHGVVWGRATELTDPT